MKNLKTTIAALVLTLSTLTIANAQTRVHVSLNAPGVHVGVGNYHPHRYYAPVVYRRPYAPMIYHRYYARPVVYHRYDARPVVYRSYDRHVYRRGYRSY